MTDRSAAGSNSNSVFGIIAVVALAAFFVWFFAIRDSDRPAPAAAAAPTPAQADSDNEVTIKVDLPDSVVIKP